MGVVMESVKRGEQRRRSTTHLGGAVQQRAHERHREVGGVALLLGAPRVKVARLPKVRHLGHVVLRDEDVVGLQVAVDQRLVQVVVQVAHALRHAHRHVKARRGPRAHLVGGAGAEHVL